MKLRSCIFALLTFSSSLSLAANSCRTLFPKDKNSKPQFHDEFSQKVKSPEELTHWLSEKSIPYFLKSTEQGEKPVILANKESIEILAELLNNTFGVQVMIRPGGRSDHGLIRLSDTQIDRSTPGGIRDFGEINDNGFSWRSMSSRIRRRKENAHTILETIFYVTRSEYKDILFYQMIRRGSFFEIPFTFGPAPEMVGKTAIRKGGEQCFTFCKANGLGSQVTSLKESIKEINSEIDIDLAINSSSFQKLLDNLKTEFEKIDPNNGAELNYRNLEKMEAYDSFLKSIGMSRSDGRAIVVVSWLVSIKATQNYDKSMSQIDLDSHAGIGEYNKKRSLGVIVYSQNPKVVQSFKDASFNERGVLYSWPEPAKQRSADPVKREGSKSEKKKINYEVFESKNGSQETIVLIHGLGSSRLTWNKVAAELAEKYRVVTYDQRGHGMNSYSGKEFHSKAMAMDLKNLLDELGIDKAHIVGHSMGGRTAMGFASEFKESTLSVTVEDMHMKGRRTRPYKLDEGRLADYDNMPDQIPKNKLGVTLKSHFNPEDLLYINARYLKELKLVVEVEGGQKLDLRALKNHLKAIHRYNVEALNEDLTKALRNAPKKTQFFAADKDKGAVLFGVGIHHLKENRPDIKIIEFPETGHGIHSAKPELFVEKLRDFIERQ